MKKFAIAEVTKIVNAISNDNKYNWAINNGVIDAARDLQLIGVKKYQKCNS